MAKSKRTVELDQFYTKESVAKELIAQINNLDKFKFILEPSAGSGAFSLQLPNCYAIDLEPKHSSIIKQDFFKYNYTGSFSRDKILVIGNPPYGRQASFAIKFIREAAKIADTIAFILPKSLKKESMQKRLPENYHLQKEIELEDNSFTIDNVDCCVPSIFQIWKNEYKKRPAPTKYDPIGFHYVKKSAADLSVRRVGGTAGHATKDLEKKEVSHYFLKCDKLNVEEMVDYLNNIIWPHNNTTGPKSISKNELNKELNKFTQSVLLKKY